MHNPPYDVYEKYVRALCAISIVVARSSANREQNFANLKKKEGEVRSKNLASGGKQNVGWECTRRDSCADVHVGLFQHQAPLCRLPFAHAVARMARHYSCFRYARPLYAFQRLFRQTRTLDPSFITISNFCNCRMFLVLSYNFLHNTLSVHFVRHNICLLIFLSISHIYACRNSRQWEVCARKQKGIRKSDKGLIIVILIATFRCYIQRPRGLLKWGKIC